jgi:hypothetical protein
MNIHKHNTLPTDCITMVFFTFYELRRTAENIGSEYLSSTNKNSRFMRLFLLVEYEPVERQELSKMLSNHREKHF